MSLKQTLSAKKGPLPVWVWALLVTVGGYLAYRRYTASSSGVSSTAQTPTGSVSSDTTPVTVDDSGSPPAAGGGSAASNVNDTLLSQLSGFQSSIDQLTAEVQQTPAFNDVTGDSSGAAVYDIPTLPQTVTTSTTPEVTPAGATKPAKQPFGGVLSVTKLKNGSLLTTYRSGRKVEQAPGETPYLVHA